ncbi:MAG TPA: sigma-70 family RNA polymerase sigma factor [Geobacteraceae bacterium]
MDFLEATAWVRGNEKVIKGKIAKYRKFSPYEECDYMQEAFEAAMIAVRKSREKGIRFEAAFWTTFRNQIGVFTPCPDIRTHGSNSVPSHLCSLDIDSVSLKARKRRRRKPDIEAIYCSICHLLTYKERQVLYLSLGIGDEGELSNYEIAERLGCVVSNVRDTLSRAYERIKRLTREGVIDPRRLY